MTCSFDCPLRSSIEVPYRGPLDADIMCVGESPGATEERMRQSFVGPSGELLTKNLLKAGINTDKVYFANAVRCRLHKDEISIKEQNKFIANCRPHLEHAIQKVKPKVLVALGDVALQQLVKLKGITKIRGSFIWSEEFSCWVFPVFHPAYILRKMAAEPIMLEDFKRLCEANERAFNFNSEEFSFKESDSIQFLLDDPPEMVAIDTETQGLDWMSPNSLLISHSIAYSPTQAVQTYIHERSDNTSDPVVYWTKKKERGEEHYKKSEYFERKLDELRDLLEHVKIKKYMMNGNFDLHHIAALYRSYNQPVPKIQSYKMDIQAAAHLLDENMYGRASLEQLRKSFTDITSNYSNDFDATYDKSNMLVVPHVELTYYACMDAIVTYHAAVNIRARLLKSRKLTNYFSKFVMPAISKTLLTMEDHGVTLDLAQLPVAKQYISDMADKYHSEALVATPKAVIALHAGKDITLRRNALVQDILFSEAGFNLKPPKQTKKGAVSVDKEARVKLEGLRLSKQARAFLDAYNLWTKYNKLHTTYIPGLGEAVKDDGRIHPNLSIVTTVTGRSSSANPNLQNIPKRGELAPHIRRLLIAPEGKILLAFDASQAELRLCAHLSQDETMMEVYNSGGDIHATTALATLRKTREEVSDKDFKEARRNAKVTNFSFIYGGSAYGFRRDAKTDYGLDFSEAEAEQYRSTYFRTYPGVGRYHGTTLSFLRKHGYVESPLGRIRRLPEIHSPDKSVANHAGRQALNHPIQSFSSDLVILACNLLLINNLLDFNECKPVLFIHDELLFEVRDEPAIKEKYYYIIKDAMERPPLKSMFGFELTVPLIADAKVGYNLHEMEDYVP